MRKALAGTFSAVVAVVFGLPTWQFALVVCAAVLLMTGVATLVVVLRIERHLALISRDQEARIDALGRARPDRLREG
jgi:hypothetical protein